MKGIIKFLLKTGAGQLILGTLIDLLIAWLRKHRPTGGGSPLSQDEKDSLTTEILRKL